MRSRPGVPRATIVGLVTLALVAGCARDNPAFFGPLDGATAGDAGHPDAAATGDAAPIPDGGCAPGAPCLAADNHCQIGTSSCAGDVASCDNLRPAPNGAFCGYDKVCKDGSCIECAAGTRCATGVECETGRLDCSLESGAPECVPTGPAPDGTDCATGVCYDGQCNSAVCGGLADPPCEGTAVCDRNGCGSDVRGVCVAKPTCPTPMPPYPVVCGCDGKTYLDDCQRLAARVALAHAGACTNATENCYNGADDNGDGLADCLDPQCQATSVCAAKLPDGWAGIGWLDPDGKPTCPPELLAQDLFVDNAVSAPPLDCSCECGAQSAHCAMELVCYGNDTTCATSTGNFTATVAGCVTVPIPGGSSGCKAGEPQVTGGCAATTKTARPAVTWPATGRACLRAGGGACATLAETCVPRPAPEAIGPCVARAGDLACPASTPYSVKRLYFTGQPVDGRTCTTCTTCGIAGQCMCDPAGGKCGVAIYDNNQCQYNATYDVPAAGPCTTVTANGSIGSHAQLVGVIPATGLQCVPGVSSQTGALSLGPKITICCGQ